MSTEKEIKKSKINPEKVPKSDLLKYCSDSENQIDLKATFKTFNFIERIIFINDNITEELAKNICNKIIFWNTIDSNIPIEERPIIKIFINTDGGELNPCFSICSMIKISETPIYTCNIGKAYSAGFLIFISGHKRFSIPNSYFLLHEGCCSCFNDAHKFFQGAKNYESMLKASKKIVLENTIITQDQYEKHKNDDWYFDNQLALDYGIIDKEIKTIVEMEERDI